MSALHTGSGEEDSTDSFCLGSSMTSTICSIRLFAVSSSLPTVTLMGSFRKVLASRLTDSGQVAETRMSAARMHRILARSQLTHDSLSSGIVTRAVSDDLSNIVLEPLVKHTVGLVEYEI